MSRIFIDGFEAGDAKLWDVTNQVTVHTGISGMSSTYCLCADSPWSYAKKNLPASKDELYFGFSYKYSENYSSMLFTIFDSGGTHIFSLSKSSDGTLNANRGDSDVFASVPSLQLTPGTVYRIEIRYKPRNSGGILQLKVNGILRINFSGDTTSAGENIQAFSLFQGPGGASVWGNPHYIDDFVVDDAHWVGNTKIQGLHVTGAGNSTQWTPSSGSNYACIDEVPPDEADYLTTNTIGQVDLYATSDLTGTIGSIKCVQVQALVKSEGAPSPTNVQLALRLASTNYFGSSHEVSSSSVQVFELWEANPNTALAWTESDVDSMEIGVKAVA